MLDNLASHSGGEKIDFENQVVLIVGESSGMGCVTESKLAAAGAKLVVTARR